MKGACGKVPLGTHADRHVLLQLRDQIQASCREESTNTVYRHYQYNYEECCMLFGFQPYPPTYESVSTFLSVHCKAGLSANSLGSAVSALKASAKQYARRTRATTWWLSEVEEECLAEWKRGALKKFGKPPRRRPPLTWDVLEKITLATEVANLAQLQVLTMAWTMHDGLLRYRELAELTVADVYWDDERGVCWLKVRDSKCNKGKHLPAERVPLMAYGSVSAYLLLKVLWNRLRMATLPAATPLFFQSAKGSGVALKAVSKVTYVGWMRAVLKRAGFAQADEYTGHSGRAGGATDMFRARMPPRLIQLGGRWKSEAYLIYIRDHPAERAEAVFRGFAALTRTR